MIHTTFIARASDGLLLCENYDNSNANVQFSKKRAKMLIKEKSSQMEPSSTIDIGEHLLMLIFN